MFSFQDVAHVSLASILLRESQLEDAAVVIKKALEVTTVLNDISKSLSPRTGCFSLDVSAPSLTVSINEAIFMISYIESYLKVVPGAGAKKL